MTININKFFKKNPVRSTMLKTFASCPLTFRDTYIKDIPYEETPTMKFGSAVHCYLLEGEREFNNKYYTYNGRLSENIKEQADGRIPIKEDEYCRIEALADRIDEVIDSKQIPIDIRFRGDKRDEGKLFERFMTWNEPQYNLPCTAKVDFMHEADNGRTTIIDLKITANATPQKWLWTAYNLWYNIQVAHYVNGYVENTGTPLKDIDFAFVVIENKRPYNVCYYKTDCRSDYFKTGKNCCEGAIKLMYEALTSNVFKQGEHVPDTMQDLYLPTIKHK